VKKTGFMCTALQYSPLHEKRGKKGNQTVQPVARSYKN